jgi:hypothetical protein
MLTQALPEPIPLDIVYEDDDLMVINKVRQQPPCQHQAHIIIPLLYGGACKHSTATQNRATTLTWLTVDYYTASPLLLLMFMQPAGMPVHISAGHHSGTLVNALLAHCGLPGVRIDPSYPSNLPGLSGDTAKDGDDNSRSESTGLQPLCLDGVSLESIEASSVTAARAPVRRDSAQATDSGSSCSRSWIMPGALRESDSGSDGEEVVLDEDEEQASDGWMMGQERCYDDDNQQPTAPVSRSRRQDEARVAAQSVLLAHGGVVGGVPGVLRPGIVHRLDMGTSGLLVVAKRESAQRALAAQFKERTVSCGLAFGCCQRTRVCCLAACW